VIYTSGSTGKPKGTLLQHSNVTRLFTATEDWFGFGAHDSWTLFHSYAFDFSVWEIWGALLYGGKLVIVPYLVARAPAQFHALLCEQQITILNQTPSAFQQLVAADQQADQQAGAQSKFALRQVIFGGEALNQAALAPWFAKHGASAPQLINMYGITETTVHVTYLPLQAGAARQAGIGRPIPDLATYILDANLNPVPIGVAGELHVAGGGLARGYLNRAGLSAERFIPDPFGIEPGGRMYKSGDLARYLPDGEIEYLGRIDAQVKVRGFRIELGEIEAVLAAVPGVSECVVLAREDSPGDQRLVAYWIGTHGITEPESEPKSAALRSALLANLPDYMVPAHFVLLERMPLTVNGKVDRRALPAPERSSHTAQYEAPTSPVEQALAEIWAEVLGLERVGRQDNFFELGGHSLLATQLSSKIRIVFEVDVPLREFFELPTIAASAILIESLIMQEIENMSDDEALSAAANFE
jgi:amino acid adenylation domain-containing protein